MNNLVVARPCSKSIASHVTVPKCIPAPIAGWPRLRPLVLKYAAVTPIWDSNSLMKMLMISPIIWTRPITSS